MYLIIFLQQNWLTLRKLKGASQDQYGVLWNPGINKGALRFLREELHVLRKWLL